MTYFDFLLRFVLPPIVVLVMLARPTLRHWVGIAALAAITYAWTTPWDNYLVASGVWAYRPTQVSGVMLGFVPVEEYLFFGLQAILGSLWTLSLLRLAQETDRLRRATSLAAIAAAWAAGPVVNAWLGGAASPTLISPVVAVHAWPPLPYGQVNYLVLILVWAVPVIVGQWALGRRIFTRPLWVWALGWMVPTLYLSASDSVAIGAGIWHILPDQSLALLVPLGRIGLPLEEAVFFLVTSLLVTQGFLLVSEPQAADTLRGWLSAWSRRREVRA